jgi:hypothetical protein
MGGLVHHATRRSDDLAHINPGSELRAEPLMGGESSVQQSRQIWRLPTAQAVQCAG